jgi:hypothetical protein
LKGVSEAEILQGGHMSFFLIYGINPVFFREVREKTLKKSGFAETDIFLGFETNLDFSNQKSGCRLKGRLNIF